MYSLGVDIGGTSTSFGIVSPTGEICCQANIPTRGHAHATAFLQQLQKEWLTSFPENLRQSVTRIGIGAPNGNYYTGCIEFAPNLEWKGIIPLAATAEEIFQIPTKITNDANAAAMGEMKYGAAQGMKNFIMVTLGTGVGSGFVANGEVIYGHDGFAGELGHVIAVRDGRSCGCGRKGCLEAYTSATGIVRTAQEFLAQSDQPSLLRNSSTLSSRSIFEAAQQQDQLALDIFHFTGTILGQSLADAVAITSPEAIILFGGLAQAGKFIFEPTHKSMEENLLSIFKNKVKLLPSALKEKDAAVLGAAALE
jgi:glucokinase